MSISAPASPAHRLRRLLVAIGAVGGPLCLALGNLIPPALGGSARQQLTAVHAHLGPYLTGAVLQAAGFALLGALGVCIAMLLPRRGGALATVGAVLTLIGGVVMGGAVLTTAFVEAALPASSAAALARIQGDPTLGSLFDFALVAAVGGVIGVIALLVGRPVRIWVPLVLLVGLLLSFAGGGPLGALLTLPVVVATVALAGALVRTPAASATETRSPEAVAA